MQQPLVVADRLSRDIEIIVIGTFKSRKADGPISRDRNLGDIRATRNALPPVRLSRRWDVMRLSR
jgi:hypothetical protein